MSFQLLLLLKELSCALQGCVVASLCHSVLIFFFFFSRWGEQTENIPRGILAQTPSGPTAAALRLVRLLKLSCSAPGGFLTALLPPTVRQPTNCKSSPLLQFATGNTFQIPNLGNCNNGLAEALLFLCLASLYFVFY